MGGSVDSGAAIQGTSQPLASRPPGGAHRTYVQPISTVFPSKLVLSRQGGGVAAVRTTKQTQDRTFIAEYNVPDREAWPKASLR